MDRYYYLASSLPLLQFGKRPHIDREYFLNQAQKWVGARDFAILCQADINEFSDKKKSTGLLREYDNFERLLREELKFIRARRGQDIDYTSLRQVSASVLEGTPLEVERKLLFLRWQFIEEKELGHYFDLEFLGLYFLKLQILERLFSFDKQKGEAAFDRLTEVSPVRDNQALAGNKPTL
ncbi:MAG: DUF2764 family protein [Candidatus Omnitrophota bacterium]